jgi:hypothetical protein
MIRKLQRRPNKSSSDMIGLPERDPRTFRVFTAAACFGIGVPPLPDATNNVAYRYLYCSTGIDHVTHCAA